MTDYDKLMGRAEVIMQRLSGLTVPKVPVDDSDDAVLENLDSRNGEAMIDWLLRVYVAFKLYFKGQPEVKKGGGRKWFTPAQAAAASLLMIRLDLTVREMEELFGTRPDLCRVINLEHPPSRMFFVRAQNFVPKKFSDFEALRTRWLMKRAREAANKFG